MKYRGKDEIWRTVELDKLVKLRVICSCSSSFVGCVVCLPMMRSIHSLWDYRSESTFYLRYISTLACYIIMFEMLSTMPRRVSTRDFVFRKSKLGDTTDTEWHCTTQKNGRTSTSHLLNSLRKWNLRLMVTSGGWDILAILGSRIPPPPSGAFSVIAPRRKKTVSFLVSELSLVDFISTKAGKIEKMRIWRQSALCAHHTNILAVYFDCLLHQGYWLHFFLKQSRQPKMQS